MKRDARGISFSLCGHSLTRAWDGRFWKMRFLAVRGNPNLATPAKRHTGARHRAARAPHTQRDHTTVRDQSCAAQEMTSDPACEKSSSQRSIELRRRERRSTYVVSHSGTPCEVASVAASASSARRFCRRRSCCRSFEPAPRLLSAHPAGTRPRFLLSAGELTAAAAGAVAATGLLAISSWVPAACSPLASCTPKAARSFCRSFFSRFLAA